MAAAAAPTSTPASGARLLLLPLLCNSLLLLLPSLLPRAAAQSAILATPPLAVNATNTALTFAAETQCPPNCGVLYITWQIKGPNGTWSPERKTHVEKPYTFEGLQSGVQYDVRALLDLGGKPYMGDGVAVAKAYTCSDKVPRVENVTDSDVGTDYVELRWHPPRQTCASVQYYFQQELYRNSYGRLSEQCPPNDLIPLQPNYTCLAPGTAGGTRECTVRIKGLEAGDKYTFGIVGVDWTGRCSVPAFRSVEAKRGPSPFGLSVGAWSCLLVVILIISASTPCIYTFWKRKTGRSLFGENENLA